MNDNVLAVLNLCSVPGLGRANAKRLIERAGSAVELLANPGMFGNETVPGTGKTVEQLLNCPSAREKAQREYEFIQRDNISCLLYDDEDYPSRLRECDDAPLILFYKGKANLNPPRSIAMVGTRRISEYGRTLCANFVRDLHELCPDIVIMSGLAYGVDIHSHRAALANGMPTIGVLAHGLDRIYPSLHRSTAVEMLGNGGLITEFFTGTNPDKGNFVSRNRIIAGMADATIVVESALKGGSLITADIALSYHRDCFAFPGRVGDEYSEGCNRLIFDNKAGLITSAEDFVKAMQWTTDTSARPKAVQRSLFPDLSLEQQMVLDEISRHDSLQINTIVVNTNIPVNRITVILFELELKGIVKSLAGGMYKLV